MTLEQKTQNTLLKQFEETRSRTLELVKTLEKDDFGIQTAYFTSPPKWHLGHVSWLNEIVLSKTQKNYEFYSEEFSKYLNSYYNQFGKPHDKAKRGLMSRPTVDQILEYYDIITKKVTDVLQNSLTPEASYLFTMSIHHECQHQELLVYDLKHLLGDQYRPVKMTTVEKPSSLKQESIKIPGGIYKMGYSGNDFCYDIELPEHKVYLNDFQIENFPVTNAQYLEFIEVGGYDELFVLAFRWMGCCQEK